MPSIVSKYALPLSTVTHLRHKPRGEKGMQDEVDEHGHAGEFNSGLPAWRYTYALFQLHKVT